jgi:hypothetical protein
MRTGQTLVLARNSPNQDFNKMIQNKQSKREKTFDTVKVFREIKEKIAKETENMTFEQFKAYLKANSLQVQQS